jgi:hypothetical protein
MYRAEPQEIFFKGTHGGVVQDKDARPRIFAASDQPPIPQQPAHMPKSPKPHGSKKRKTVEIGVCIMPTLKAELLRLGEQWGSAEQPLSISKVAATLIEKGVQGNIDMQYGAMLKPVIEAIFDRLFQRYLNEISDLAFRGAYSAEQGRILQIHNLRFNLVREAEMDENSPGLDELPLIISSSQSQALKNLKHHIGDTGDTLKEKPVMSQ